MSWLRSLHLPNCWTLLILAIVVVFPLAGLASNGDEDPAYRKCVQTCAEASNCDDGDAQVPLPLYLRLFGWTCVDECRYNCMHQLSKQRHAEGLPVRQYYGKWPFIRVLGFQEFFSAIFSAINGLSHLIGFLKYRRAVPERMWFMTPLYRINIVICLNAWLWSTVYHSRDRMWTEWADYFGAFSMVLYALYYSLVRVFAIKNAWKQVGLFVPFFVLYASHVSYLAFVKFSYSWNLAVNLTAGSLFCLVWLVWAIFHRHLPFAKYAVAFVIWCIAASFFELIDLPPLLGLIDSHAMWHISTTPAMLIWYKFLTYDAIYHLGQYKAV